MERQTATAVITASVVGQSLASSQYISCHNRLSYITVCSTCTSVSLFADVCILMFMQAESWLLKFSVCQIF